MNIINSLKVNEESFDIGSDSQNVTYNSSTVKDVLDELTGMILDKLYPIGSIYLETTNTNPCEKLGGTWEEYGTADSYLRLGGNGSGGNNTITVENLPSHSHGLNAHTHSIPSLSGSTGTEKYNAGTNLKTRYGVAYLNSVSGQYTGGGQQPCVSATCDGATHTHSVTTTSSTTGGNSGNTTAVGGGTDFEPKYVQVYAWKRTA